MIKYAPAVIGIFMLALVAVFMYHSKTPTTVSIQQTSTVAIGATTIVVDVANTPALRQQGLSGKESLPWGTGMLFIFPQEGGWRFWMKDMNFAIDIIWANKDGVISTVHSDVSPQTYPESFHPLAPALYVLEVPAGYAAAHDIGVGQKIVVQYKERVE